MDREFSDTEKFRLFRRDLFHASLTAILGSLHAGMTTPEVTLCPDGHYRCVMYGLGPYIADYLEQVQLAEFINQLPDGLETWVAEQGLRLSGGERQRLAIARALLKNAPLLILDEATANLDSLTECALLDALDVLMRGRTTLMITHRLVAMERMDEILVLDSGRVCERGTHSQLLAADSLYRRMFDVQNGMLALEKQEK